MGDFFDDATKTYKRSGNTPDYPAPWVSIGRAEADALIAAQVPVRHWKLDGGNNLIAMTAQEQHDADYPTLDDYKTAIAAACDAECERRMALGFSHASKQFSLALKDQITFLTAPGRSASLTFPLRFSTIDNLDSILVSNTGDIDAIYASAYDTKAAMLADTDTVKHGVRGAVDATAVDTAAASYLGGGPP